MQTTKFDTRLDSVLVVSVAVFVFWQGYFSSTDSYKYCNVYLLFWLKGIIGAIAAGATALKGYRSSSFSDYKNSAKNIDNKIVSPENPKNGGN